MTFGENVRARRRALGKSQEQVAKEVGVHRITYTRYELIDAMPRTPERLMKLAKALECTVDDLYEDYRKGQKGGLVILDKNELESILKNAHASMLTGAIAIETNKEDLNQIAIEMLRHHADEIKAYLNRLE